MDPNFMESVSNWLPQSTKEKLLNPSAEAIGLGISALFYKIFYKPIRYGIVQRQEVNDLINRTSEKVSKIPKDKQTLEKRGLIAKSVENSQYSLDSDQLREMFANIIANTTNKDYVGGVYPVFPTILSNMAPHDAYFIKRITTGNKIREKIALEDFVIYGQNLKTSEQVSLTYARNIICIKEGSVTLIDRPEQSINLLQSFGILKITDENPIGLDPEYEVLENKYFNSNRIPKSTNEFSWLSPKGHRKILEVTDLGKLFLESILGIYFN
ncbi:MAG: DUF4393 domain-containing protein [Lactobacillus sp.]|nr:DUF4393 domain-containing protein [Lactobacillus sp.]